MKRVKMGLDIGYIMLAGGKSKRLGHDKLKEVIGEMTLLERVISILAAFQGEIMIVAGDNSSLPPAFSYPKIKIVYDLYPGKGMLGGIITGLSLSPHDYNLVVACDMPFLSPALLQYMIDIADGNDLVTYREKNNLEPLHAIYSRNCLPVFEEIMQQNLRIIELVQHVRVRYLTAEEIKRYDPENLSFFNINTEADLRMAHKIVAGKNTRQ